MNNGNILFVLSPRITTRIIALVLALLVAFASARVLTSVWSLSEAPEETENDENEEPCLLKLLDRLYEDRDPGTNLKYL